MDKELYDLDSNYSYLGRKNYNIDPCPGGVI
jgi:hypothetical protein